MLPRKLYREEAIERLSTPERLDTLLQATTVRSWLALAGVGLIVLAVAGWGVLGRLSDDVAGAGIILRDGGVFGIQASASGTVAQTLLSPGGEVAAGQPVARIAQPELEDQLRAARARRAAVEKMRDRTAALVAQGTRLQVSAIEQERRQLAARLSAAREQVKYQESRSRQDREALERGLISPGDYQESVQQLRAAQEAVESAIAAADGLEAQIPAVQNQALHALLEFEDRLRASDDEIRNLEYQLEVRGLVTSPYRGRIVEVLADEGESVSAGTQLMLLEMANRPIEAMVFVSEAGRRVLPGMTVRMSPAGLKPEEFGYMLGTVTRVSDFPATPAYMNRIIRNPALVDALSGQGHAYAVTVALQRDSTTVSGFRWTSRRGPPLQIGSGTLVTAVVPVREYRPVSMVFPTVRRWLGR